MKYFLDTEFLEGTQKKWFEQTKPTIDLISISIVAEDGREYYAISKDFNLKEAWNRYDEIKDGFRDFGLTPNYKKVYWLRDNVLLPIHYELAKRGLDFNYTFSEWKDIITAREHGIYADRHYKTLKKLIKEYGKSNKQIAEDIKDFVFKGQGQKIRFDNSIQFYGYYSDYDWVVFCWLFGKMINLPTGFPMYCIDLKQELDNKVNNLNWLYLRDTWNNSRMSIHTIGKGDNQKTDRLATLEEKLKRIKELDEYPKQTNEHNALADAKWNFELYKFLNKL